MRERLRGQLLAARKRNAVACRHVLQHARVVGRIDDDGHALMILGGGADHRRPADIDVLDRVFVGAIRLRHGGGEWIQIHDQQIDRLDAVRLHDVLVDVTAEQTAVNLRMQRLHAAVHDFRKTGVRRDLRHRNPVLPEQRGRSARGKNRDASFVQSLCEFDETVFVGNAEKGAANGHRMCLQEK